MSVARVGRGGGDMGGTNVMGWLGLGAAVLALTACGEDHTSAGTGADAGTGTGATDVATSVDDASTADVDDGADAPPPFDYPCVPGTIESCVTSCESAGQRFCLKDWTPCKPPDEFCGNCADDDCDGAVDEGCPGACTPTDPPPVCPTAVITTVDGGSVGVGATLHLSAASSSATTGATVASYAWSVVAPPGSDATFAPSATVATPTFTVDVAGSFFFSLEVTDSLGTKSCRAATLAVTVAPFPPVVPEVGCADGQREGFVEQATYTRIAGCAGAWDAPGVTPDSVVPTCGRQGGDDGAKASGLGCASADLCAAGWHVCSTWREVAAASPTGCAGATPPGAAAKSLFFAIRQPSETGSVCGEWGDGDNDVFGCGNLGNGLPTDKQCGPLDRVLASTVANSCGFNEAEPNLGPWQCLGPADGHLHEGALVTKKACQGGSCSYDGHPVSTSDKGGVLCCRD